MSEEKSPLRDPRIANLDMVRLSVEGSAEYRYEQIDNFSRSGVFVRTETPFPISTRVLMVFTLVAPQKGVMGSEPKLMPVEVHGKVVRVVRGTDSPGMGVKFINLNPKATDIIDEIVTQRLETTPTGV